jgi:hypothetical protein
MTTPNNQRGIQVDGAPGGSFYVHPNPQSSHEKIKCTYCREDKVKEDIPVSCLFCLIQICTKCVGFGYEQVHKARCKGGICDNDRTRKYVCTCGHIPQFRECSHCLAEKTAKYNCFNCGVSFPGPKKATFACNECNNHFVCSKQCHDLNMGLAQNHGLTCGKSLPVWCGHGVALLLTKREICHCKMCEHGMWAEDCFICIAENHTKRMK